MAVEVAVTKAVEMMMMMAVTEEDYRVIIRLAVQRWGYKKIKILFP